VENEDPKSLLLDVAQHHIVEVHNPLTKDFTWQVARPIPAGQKYQDPYMDKLGMRTAGLKSGDDHVFQKVTLPAGKSYKIPGDVAKVVIPHLVDEIMQIEHDKRTIADPNLRLAIEKRILINIDSLRSQLSTQSLEEQLNSQLENLNSSNGQEEVINEPAEQAFPDLDGTTTGRVEEDRPADSVEADKVEEFATSDKPSRTKATKA